MTRVSPGSPYVRKRPEVQPPRGCKAVTQKIMRGSEKLQPGELLVSKSGTERIFLGYTGMNMPCFIRRSIGENNFKLDNAINLQMIQTALKNRSARVYRLDGSKSRAIVEGNREMITNWFMCQTFYFDENHTYDNVKCAIDREGRIVWLDYNVHNSGSDQFLFALQFETYRKGENMDRAFLPLDNFESEGQYRYPAEALLRLIAALESWPQG